MEQDGGSTVQRHGAASLTPTKTVASGSLFPERKSGKMHRNEDIDDILTRLRDIPQGIGGHYYHIIQTSCEEIELLRKRLREIKEGFEGCCPACELVGEMNKRLREERDEARRLYCEEWAFTIELERGEAGDPFDLALEKGWDCYPQRKKSNAAMDELARLDEELGLNEPPNEGFLQDLG